MTSKDGGGAGGFTDLFVKLDSKDSKSERSNTPESLNMSDYDPGDIPQKKRPSLYKNALTRGEASSGANSPGLVNRIVKKYFDSGVSTPVSHTSDNEFVSTPREMDKEKSLSFF